MKQIRIVIALLVIAALWYWQQAPTTRDEGSSRPARPAATPESRQAVARPADRHLPGLPSFLPAEAHRTLALIDAGGPFPHRQDGAVFQNRERRLPSQRRGYYREYTVRTPGESDRGARRIVTGGEPPAEYWYSDDHYRSFRRFEVPR